MAATISLTGRLAIDIDGVRADEARLGRLGRVAFAYLAAQRHRPVRREELARVVWGDDLPEAWEDALGGVLSRVRSVLTEVGLTSTDTIRSQFGCYQLRLGTGVLVDVEEASAAASAAERALDAAPAEAAELARRAAAVAARPFLPGASGSWVERRQADLAALRVRSVEVLSRAASATGDHAAAVAAAEEAVQLAPSQESTYQRLMEAHLRAGDRTAARQVYERCRHFLSPSSDLEAAYVRLLEDETIAGVTPTMRLPHVTTTFIGRQAKVREVAERLGTARIVTLTGAPGVGKSRLAVHVAAGLVGAYPDGVWHIELDAWSDPGLIAEQVLWVLGVPETTTSPPLETLTRFVANRRLLLVFDNCEHIAGGCAGLIRGLVRSAPGLRVLATSRKPMDLADEAVVAVPPLSTPPQGDEAVRLFRDRARIHDHDPDVVGVCVCLQGIPLAVELAAARTGELSVAHIARQLEGIGHDPLRAVIDWTVASLAPDEQLLFARLSVFAGGFTAEAVHRVCGASDHLPLLVDKALIVPEPDSKPTRYRMLEALRQCAAGLLDDQEGGRAALRTRHLAWATALAEQAAHHLEGVDQATWLQVLDAEQDNLRAALDRAAASNEPDLGLRLAASLLRFWEIRGSFSEGRQRLDFWAGAADGPPELRAKALNAAAVLAQRQRDHDTARAYYEESLVIRRALNDKVGAAVALHGLGNIAVASDDLATAQALFEENLAIGTELGQERMVAASLMNLGVVAHYSFLRGRRDRDEGGEQARQFYERSLDAYRELGDSYGVALALENLGGLGPFIGDYERSRLRHEESLAIRRELGDKAGIATSARFLAARATWVGELATARQLHEEVLAIERELGNKVQVANALASLGELADQEGDGTEAHRLFDEALSLYREVGDRTAQARVLGLQADLTRRQRDLHRARSTLAASAAIVRELKNDDWLIWLAVQHAVLAADEGELREAVRLAWEAMGRAAGRGMPDAEATALRVLARVARKEGELPRAARLLGSASALTPPSGDHPHPLDTEWQRDLDAVRDGLGERLFDALWAQGQRMEPGERQAYARAAGGEELA